MFSVRALILQVAALGSLTLPLMACVTSSSAEVKSPLIPVEPRAGRVLSNEVADYFTDTLRKAEGAATRAFAERGFACNTWVPFQFGGTPEEGVIRPGGLEPLRWNSGGLCKSASGDALLVSVELSGEAVAADVGVTLLDARRVFAVTSELHCQAQVTVALGVEGRRKPTSNPPLQVARPETLRLSVALQSDGVKKCSAETTDSFEVSALQRLDRGILGTGLLGLPTPPLLPAIHGGRAALTVDDHQRIEQDIWRDLIGQGARAGAESVVVVTQTSPRYQLDVKAFRAAWPDVDPSAILDFNRRNTAPEPFPNSLSTPGHLTVLSEHSVRQLFDGPDGWKAFHRRYPGANGLLTVSPVGIGREGSIAVVYFGSTVGPLSGRGELLVLRRSPQGWIPLYRQELWVS